MSRNQLKKRADGRYKVNYRNKQFYGKTRAEALRKRAEYVKRIELGLDGERAKLSFGEYGLKWIEIYHSQCMPAQRKQYAGFVNFASGCIGSKPICDIKVTDIQLILNRLTDYSASYVAKFMNILRGIFKTAAAEGAILRNPMDLVKRPRCKKCVGHRALEPWERKLITDTYKDHSFGLCAMVMLYAGLRRGEALYIDVDRDVDFDKMTLTVNGAVSFSDGNSPAVSDGKTENARRTIPIFGPLAEALKAHKGKGLICPNTSGKLMSETSFRRKYDSYITFLETQLNGCHKRWYGKLNAHKALTEAGGSLPEWKNVSIRCHDFRVDFCTRAYYAGVNLKTLQMWMGHADSSMILRVYTKLSKQEADNGAELMEKYIETAV